MHNGISPQWSMMHMLKKNEKYFEITWEGVWLIKKS